MMDIIKGTNYRLVSGSTKLIYLIIITGVLSVGAGLSLAQDVSLDNGSQRLVFNGQAGSGSFGIILYQTSGSSGDYERVGFHGSPISVTINNGDSQDWREASYSTVTSGEDGVVATGTITSGNGTRFEFSDYYEAGAPGIILQRSVEVSNVDNRDSGFFTGFALNRANSDNGSGILMPGLIYNGYFNGGVGGSNGANIVRTDRLPVPVVLALDRETGYGIGLWRSKDEASGTIEADNGRGSLTDERLTYSSLGFIGDRNICSGIEWHYPGSEWDFSYGYEGPMWRWHPVREGFTQSSSVMITSGYFGDYSGMVNWTAENAVSYYDPEVRRDLSLDNGLNASVGALQRNFEDVGQAMSGITCGANMWNGIPWNRVIMMGFIGTNTRMAFAMLYQGLRNNDSDLISKSEQMLDGWADHSGDGLAHTRWDFNINGWVDNHEVNNVYLRIECEGHKEVLEAFQLAREYGEIHENWRRWSLSFADWLVENQNNDGSWYRQYRITDNVGTETAKNATYAPLAYLCVAYEETGNQSYLDAAAEAGEFIWTNYLEEGHYRGGTPDNANILDKEAFLFPMEGYIGLYKATGESKWLKRAEQAASHTINSHFVVDLPMPEDHSQDYSWWPVGDNTAGISVISTGPGVDSYGVAWAWCLKELYYITDKDYYSKMADLITYNTLQLMDLSGVKNFAHPGFMQELWIFSPAGENHRGWCRPDNWVPWATAGVAYGIAKLKRVDLLYGNCEPTPVTPYVRVNSGTWVQDSSVEVTADDTVTLGPQPVETGSWTWTGCGTSGTSREQIIFPETSCTATAVYTNECGSESSQEFYVNVDGTGIKEEVVNNIKNKVFISPDPLCQGRFFVELPKSLTWAEIKIFNSQGRRVYSTTIKGDNRVKVNSELESGVYFVNIKTEESYIMDNLIIVD